MNRLLRFGPICAAIIGITACGGGGRPDLPAPTTPEAAVRSFMSAVQANSLVAMGELWGGGRGPARSYMDTDDLEKRLTVIQTYMRHESYEILRPASPRIGDRADLRTIDVRLSRRGCTPVVPFTVVRYRDGWLVNQIDLEAAGNPTRRCR